MDDDRARQIVEYVVDFVEDAGRFEGRGKDRHLYLQDILDFRTGAITHAMDRLTEYVQAIIDGKATYRPRAASPSEARPA